MACDCRDCREYRSEEDCLKILQELDPWYGSDDAGQNASAPAETIEPKDRYL